MGNCSDLAPLSETWRIDARQKITERILHIMNESVKFARERIGVALATTLAWISIGYSAPKNVPGPSPEKSEAMERFEVDDSRNDFYTLFRYTPIEGLSSEEGVGRRDPSNIITVGDYYYVWYTRISGLKPTEKAAIPCLASSKAQSASGLPAFV